jgi:hypothetical protein
MKLILSGINLMNLMTGLIVKFQEMLYSISDSKDLIVLICDFFKELL